MLSGKKTYLAALTTIVGIWTTYLSGAMDGLALADAIQTTVVAILAVTLRAGVAAGPTKVPPSILILPLLLLAGGCQTSPGGYTADQVEYNYDWAQETYIGTVENLLILKRSGAINQEDWDKSIYPLILQGDEILDIMEAATLDGDTNTLDVKLVAFKSLYRRLVLWTLNEQGAIDGTTTTFTLNSSPGCCNLRGHESGPGTRPKSPGAAEGGSQAISRAGWQRSVAGRCRAA